MGQKANPRGLRLGIVTDWDGNWFAQSNYAELLYQDFLIRNFIKVEFAKAGVSRVVINRKANYLEVIVTVGRPGVVFGKVGLDVKDIQENLKKVIRRDVTIHVQEDKNADTNAKLVADWVCSQLEKRVTFRRAMKQAVQRVMKSGVKGIKIQCSGRLGGVEIARTEWYREGKVPLHTLRAQIDYAFSEALTTYGKIGVKVWVYHGEVLTANNDKEAEKVR